MKIRKFVLLFFLLVLTTCFSQVGVNTTSPNASAELDISSTNKGVLIPRIALTATDTESPVVSPAISLLVFNTNFSGSGLTAVTPGYYYWDGSGWIRLSTGSSISSGWSLNGNSGTNSTTNFIGTTDNTDLVFKRNYVFSGTIQDYNTAFGTYSFNLSTNSGNYNSSFGHYNLNGNNSGSRNTALGAQNLYSNTSGSSNIAIGYAVLAANTTGTSNIGMGGFTSLYNNTTGSNNIALGDVSLYNNISGSNNLAIGATSLYDNTTANQNVAVGSYSLRFNTTGSNNNGIGVYSMYLNTTGTNNVGIGNSASYINSTGNNNTAIGNESLYLNSIGNNNVAIGKSAGFFATGNNNIVIGYDANVPNAASDNQVRIGNTNITYAATQVAWSITSDKRLKSNIQKSNLGLDFISKLHPVSYFRENDAFKRIEYGFIAQELEQLLKASGVTTSGIITKDDQGFYSVRYNDLLAPIVKAIQEQNDVIKQERDQNQKLKNQIDTLEKRLQVIEEVLNKK